MLNTSVLYFYWQSEQWTYPELCWLHTFRLHVLQMTFGFLAIDLGHITHQCLDFRSDIRLVTSLG